MSPLDRRGLAPILLAAALAACSREAPRETRFLSFDPESSAGALVVGWSGFEKTEPGDTFVWAQAREARVRVVADGPADRLVRFRAWPLWWEGAPQQEVTVLVNDVTLGKVALGDGPRVYRLEAPAPAWKAGENVVTFRFLWAEAPRDRLPGATDTRTLAAAFDWLEVLPVAAAVPTAK